MFNDYKVLVYDNNNMTLFNGCLKSVEHNDNFVETTTLIDGERSYIPINTTTEFVCLLDEKIIELDPTTMKRIAVYNKDVELKEYQDKIKDAKKELKNLKNELKNEQNKYEEVINFITSFTKSNFEHIDDFYRNRFDFDDYDYED